jgi:ATP-dependent Clp protease ATP-binding subunit ClpC
VNPFERLSGEAKRALTLAQDEATRVPSRHLGTEHLLLGLLGVEGCLGATVLAGAGVDLAAARAAIDSVPRRAEWREIAGDRVPTSRVKRVIELAFQEALRTRQGVVGTGAVLVGLLLEVDGLASHVLRELGVTVDGMREALARLAGSGVEETL